MRTEKKGRNDKRKMQRKSIVGDERKGKWRRDIRREGEMEKRDKERRGKLE